MIRLSPAALALAAMMGAGIPAAAQEVAPSPTPSPVTLASPAPDGRPVLELSLDETVRRTLENNVDIAVERYSPQSNEHAVSELKAFYEPYLVSTLTNNSRTAPGTSVFAGGERVTTDTVTYNFGAFENLPTGGVVRFDFNNNRRATNNVFESFNPAYGSNFNFNLTQPLLRDFSIDSNRYQIRVAKNNHQISDVQFRQTVLNTVANVKQSYYDLLYAIDNLEANRKNLGLAQRLLEENRIKVRVGTLAPLDVVAAESEVALREETVILAEAAVAEAEDALKRAMFASNDPVVWSTRIVPTDRPTAEAVTVDVDGAIKTALEKRIDLRSARLRVESADYGVRFARNQLLPSLDLVANYGTTGVGGTFIEREGFGGPILRTVPGGYGDAVSDVFGREFPTWSVGLNITYPVLNRQASASSARARVARDQSEANVKRLEMQITQEVRSAARAVETNFKRVASTRAARVLQERRLDAETKKFAAGMSTNFLVTQAQRDLALAEVAELRAIADYRKSIVNFERVQEAGVGGGGSSAIVSLGGGGSSGGQRGSGDIGNQF